MINKFLIYRRTMVLTLKALIRTHLAVAATGEAANTAKTTLEQRLKVNYVDKISSTHHKTLQQHMREEISNSLFNKNYSLFIWLLYVSRQIDE